MNIKELDQTYVVPSYARFPVVLTHGKGSLVYDENGKKYIDLGTGIAVNGFGVSDEAWQAAVTEQLAKLPHTSNLYYSEPCAKLAQMLCERTGMKKVFFSNSGAEANECAIKAARRRAFLKYGDGHSTIITLKNSFHGRTVTTLAATGQDTFHTEFGPFTEGFVYAEANNTESVRALAEAQPCAAVMMELVQGEGGVCALSQTFVSEVAALCKEKDMLLVIDEVQTGNGRTGTLYAFQQYGIKPDIVSTAKGLGGGLPIGATMLAESVQDVFTPGSHGSTFGGNPVCAAGACNIISRTTEDVLNGVKERSAYIFQALNGAKGVKSVSGLGLMIGIETERPAKEVVGGCMEQGVLVLTAKQKVRLLPALNIPMEQLAEAIEILKKELAK